MLEEVEVKRLFNNIGVGIVILILELISYKVFEGVDLLSFFALWALFLFLLLISNIFNLFGGVQQGYHIGNISILREMSETPKTKNRVGGFMRKENIIFLVFIILNIIGYLLSK